MSGKKIIEGLEDALAGRFTLTSPTPPITREQWNAEFRVVAATAEFSDGPYRGCNPAEDCWDSFFEDGLCPRDAILEDMDNA